MIRLALRHHLKTTANTLGRADLQPLADGLAAVGLGCAHGLEKTHHGLALACVAAAECLKTVLAIGGTILEALQLLLESRFVDDARAVRAQNLLEFEIAVHGFLRVRETDPGWAEPKTGPCC